MASLRTVLVGNALKLEPDLKKHTAPSLSVGKTNFNATESQKDRAWRLEFREALSHLKEGTRFESSVYVLLLQECINRTSLTEARCVHGHIIKTGTHENVFVMTFLVNVYEKCVAIEDARKVFDNMPSRNVVTWTSLMLGYFHNSQPDIAVNIFREMLKVGLYPTNYTLGVVLGACSSLFSIELGKQIHGYIIKYGIEGNTSVGNSLSRLYSKCGRLDSSIKAFRRIWEKDVVSWTTAISSCSNNGDAVMGLNLFIEMLNEGVEPNEFTLTSTLSLCSVMQALDLGSQIHSLSIKLECESSVHLTNSIMYLYLKSGWINAAKKLFDGMETTSLITWNAMISGLAQTMDLAEDSLSAHRCGFEALNMFSRLKRLGMKPDLYTFSSVLTVCSNLVALEQGEQIHAHTIKTGSLYDVVVGTALVNMYNKCGRIEQASKAFIEMSDRTLISWTSMITAFSQHSRSQQALELFEDMILVGVRPNQITFVAVLSACSHAGMVDKAMGYFEMMKNVYRIKPLMDHYACLVDMFVRLGRLEKAFDIIKNMNFKPSEFIWSNLIAGCRSHGKMDFAFYAVEQLLSLKPKDPEIYTLILNMYLSAGRWKDVSMVKKMMKDEKIGKLKDWSWISIKEKVHSFKSGYRYEEEEKLMGDLLEKAKALGYKSRRCLEVASVQDGEEGTTSSNVHHSEKLAVAFGLLNVPNGVPIRVIKSISVCRDCHSFIKFASVLADREIIIRDSKRLHKFVDGQCSCGDFASLL